MKISSLPVVATLSLALLLLGACGALSSLGSAARESAALDARAQSLSARSDELERKLDLLERTLEAYGPLAEDLGPEIKKGYDNLQEHYGQARELLGEARSLEQATDEEGDTDWLEYALLMAAGGGGLYSERRRTAKERDRVHARLDKRKAENAELRAALEARGPAA